MGMRRNFLGNACVLVTAAVLILDARTAAGGVKDGIVLCLASVVPALFPFLILSSMLTGILVEKPLPFLRPLGRLLRVPTGSEGLILAGLIGGYPIGAKMALNAHRNGSLSKQDCKRMLGFCNQAGPAFLFGMLGPIISTGGHIWLIWGLQLISALMTGMLLPGKCEGKCLPANQKKTTLTDSLSAAVHTMATVCGWVIVFRVILAFASRWFLWLLPQALQVLLTGFLELSNGCTALSQLESPSTVMIMAGIMLSFGGICVMMQTVTLCGKLGTGLYFPGKVLQASINCFLSIAAACFYYPETASVLKIWITIPLFVSTFVLVVLYRKKL